jgi:hypothetical protein
MVTNTAEGELLFRQQLTDFSIGLIESPGFWEAVEAVAHALMEHGTLDAEYCKKIIKQAKSKAGGITEPDHYSRVLKEIKS